jgi:hypothetical protein
MFDRKSEKELVEALRTGCNHQWQQKDPPTLTRKGADKGGIIVRQSESLKSPELGRATISASDGTRRPPIHLCLLVYGPNYIVDSTTLMTLFSSPYFGQ